MFFLRIIEILPYDNALSTDMVAALWTAGLSMTSLPDAGPKALM